MFDCSVTFDRFWQGAATTCYVALNPQVEGITGKYFSDSNLATPTAKATDTELSKKLWDFTMNLISAWSWTPSNLLFMLNIFH